MPKIRIEYQRNNCIGAFACVSLDPERWAMANDSKADLINGIPFENDGEPWFYLELTVEDEKVLEDESEENFDFW